MNYLERIARRATGQAADEVMAQPRVRTTHDGQEPVELPADHVAVPVAASPASMPPPASRVPAQASSARAQTASPAPAPAGEHFAAHQSPPAERPSARAVVAPAVAPPVPERAAAPVVGLDAGGPGPLPEAGHVVVRTHEPVRGEERVVRVERRVVQQSVRRVAAASRPQSDPVAAVAPGSAGAPLAPPVERGARASRAPDPAPAPVQSLDDLLRQVPGQAEAQAVAAPVSPTRPSVTIGRLVVEVTPPVQRPPSAARGPRRRRRGAWSDTSAGVSSRLRFGLGQS